MLNGLIVVVGFEGEDGVREKNALTRRFVSARASHSKCVCKRSCAKNRIWAATKRDVSVTESPPQFAFAAGMCWKAAHTNETSRIGALGADGCLSQRAPHILTGEHEQMRWRIKDLVCIAPQSAFCQHSHASQHHTHTVMPHSTQFCGCTPRPCITHTACGLRD